MNWPWSDPREYRCGDKTFRLVYKFDTAFPLYAKEWVAQASANLELLDRLKAGLQGAASTQIHGFFIHINETNNSLQAEFRCAYAFWARNPCGPDEWVREAVRSTLAEQRRLRRMQVELQRVHALAREGRIPEAVSMLNSVATRGTLSEVEDEVRGEMEKASEVAGEWQAKK